jgi:hypothetical protein
MDAKETADLAALFQRTAPRGDDVGCAAPEKIWAAVSGDLPFAELRALTDHSVRCGDCSEALRLARELRAASAPSKKATIPRWSPGPRWLIGVALAAGVAGLLAVSTNLRRNGTEPELERGVAAPEIRSALANARQPHASLVLRWWPYPRATRYTVTLATEDLRVLFQKSGLETPEVAVPPATLAGLSPRARLVWRVEATLSDGRSIESPAFTVDLD